MKTMGTGGVLSNFTQIQTRKAKFIKKRINVLELRNQFKIKVSFKVSFCDQFNG